MGIKADVIKYITDKLQDVSPETVDIYTERFSTMSDKQVQDYINKYGIRMIQTDEVDSPTLDKFIKKMNIVTEER